MVLCSLATFLVRRASPTSSFRISKKQVMGDPAIDRYREAQQIIAQLLLSRAEQPRRDEYRAAVICLHETILQLVTASVPRRYLEVLISGKRPWQCLQICRSTQYNLLDHEGRKGALAHLWIVLDSVIPRPKEPGEEVPRERSRAIRNFSNAGLEGTTCIRGVGRFQNSL